MLRAGPNPWRKLSCYIYVTGFDIPVCGRPNQGARGKGKAFTPPTRTHSRSSLPCRAALQGWEEKCGRGYKQVCLCKMPCTGGEGVCLNVADCCFPGAGWGVCWGMRGGAAPSSAFFSSSSSSSSSRGGCPGPSISVPAATVRAGLTAGCQPGDKQGSAGFASARWKHGSCACFAGGRMLSNKSSSSKRSKKAD